MPLRAQRPAPPPPVNKGSRKSNLNALIDNTLSSDSNNNRQSGVFSRPTVIRPSSQTYTTRLKKKPPPRPAPPKNYQGQKKGVENVGSHTPDLLADLADIFSAPQKKSGPAQTSSRPVDPFSNQNAIRSGSLFQTARQASGPGSTLSQQSFPFRPAKKYPAPVPSKNKAGGEMSLIDFETPLGTAHLTPSDTLALASAVNKHKSLLDWDTPIGKPSSQSSSFDLLCGNSPLNHAAPTLAAQGAKGLKRAPAAANYVLQQTSSLSSQYKETVVDWGASSLKDQPSPSEFSPPEPKFPPPPPPTPAEEDGTEWTHVSVLEVCTALYDFVAETPEDLSLRVGDRVEVELKQNKDWWTGRCNGRRGIFPSNFVESESSVAQEKQQDLSEEPSGCFARALHTFTAEQPTDLPFQEGDTVQVLYRINQDWLFGTCRGKEGQFPASFVSKIGGGGVTSHNMYRAMYAFRAENGDELSFSEGARIIVTDKSGNDWWKGRLESDPTRKTGLFPANFVELCS